MKGPLITLMPGQVGMKLSNKLTIKDVDVQGKRVLVRVDYNVPQDEQLHITNNQRIVATLPTIKYLVEKRAKRIVLISHLGRPDGERVAKLSLKPAAIELERLLHKPVKFVDDCVGSKVEEQCAQAEEGAVILLENLRFHVAEEGTVKRKDGSKVTATKEELDSFRASLSSLGDLYVNDAFGTVHRAHSSITGLRIEPKVAGLLVAKELDYFSRILEASEPIDLAILGGGKVTDKIQLIKNLLPKIRRLIVGTAMCFPFLKVLKGMSVGKSLYDSAGESHVTEILREAERLNVEIILPVDLCLGREFSNATQLSKCTVEEGIPEELMGLDIGPKTADLFHSVIKECKSILWNGPVGAFELDQFSAGTKTIVTSLVQVSKAGAMTIVGGGDSGAAVAKFGAEHDLSHVSTGGGASLELLEGHDLPGIVALTDRQ